MYFPLAKLQNLHSHKNFLPVGYFILSGYEEKTSIP